MRTFILLIASIFTLMSSTYAQCHSARFSGGEDSVAITKLLPTRSYDWLRFDDNFTIETWVKFDSTNPRVPNTVFNFRSGLYSIVNHTDSILISNNNGTIEARIGLNTFLTTDTLSDTSWMHIELVRDTAIAKAFLFINGVALDSAFCANNQLGDTGVWTYFEIGTHAELSGWHNKMYGDINTLRISKYAEHRTNFTPECLLSDTSVPNPLLYLNFNGHLQSSYDSAGVSRTIGNTYASLTGACITCDTLSDTTSTTIVRSSSQQNDVLIYPNPSNDRFVVVVPGYEPTHGIITDMVGQVVRELTFTKTTEISDLPAGVYILEIGNSKVRLAKR